MPIIQLSENYERALGNWLIYNLRYSQINGEFLLVDNSFYMFFSVYHTMKYNWMIFCGNCIDALHGGVWWVIFVLIVLSTPSNFHKICLKITFRSHQKHLLIFRLPKNTIKHYLRHSNNHKTTLFRYISSQKPIAKLNLIFMKICFNATLNLYLYHIQIH